MEALEAYHHLFFDVRPHLDRRDWIVVRAIGAPCGSLAGRPLGAVWKFFAYIGGPIALNAVIDATADAPPTDLAREACDAAAACRQSRQRLMVRLLVALLCARSPEELAPLVELRRRLLRLDGRTGEAGEAGEKQAGVLTAAEEFLLSLAAGGRSARRADIVRRPEDAAVVEPGRGTTRAALVDGVSGPTAFTNPGECHGSQEGAEARGRRRGRPRPGCSRGRGRRVRNECAAR